jgi:hypothetical protein
MSEARETADLYPSIVESVGSGTGNFYRTGTFTPVWSSASATDTTASITTGTYNQQVGEYIRVGDLVFYSIYLQSPSTWTYTNNGATGQVVYISGLPFKGANSNTVYEQWGGAVNYYDNWTFSAGYSIQPLVRNNETHIRLYYNISGQATNVLTQSIDEADSLLYVTGVYRTEDA